MSQFACPITGLAAHQIDAVTYRIEYNFENLIISLGITFNALSKEYDFIKNRHLIAGAILNKQLDDRDRDGLYHFSLTASTFKEKLNNIIYPKTPKAKLDNLLRSLYLLQTYDGELVNITQLCDKPDFYFKHFFKSGEECRYYINELHEQGYIFLTSPNFGKVAFVHFKITFKGLNHYIEITEQGDLSKRCFVAMSFDNEMREIRECIKSVIQNNGFEPVVIDETLIDSSQTINDAIISEIKSCKFCIADFTHQKDGVYFESGFAVGLGKPVIYTCNVEWFSKSHFDTNHFPHIIYDSKTDLYNKLDAKINAWIK